MRGKQRWLVPDTNVPTLAETYTHNAASWLGTRATLIKLEDLLQSVKNLDHASAETFFTELLGLCGMGESPADWRERVSIGADREQSGTVRENLVTGRALEVSNELPDAQRKLVDYPVPGLRALLGDE